MDALGLKNQAHALRKVENEDRGEVGLPSPSGFQKYATVSEAGLYLLIMQSNKDSAKKFQKWVTKEVLPYLRLKIPC
ncbi:MAG: Bro-N domain-containing protein [Bacteriovorax sp.]|nr:Bro-N domain-containing protein [Bacteriovorax sp.]